MLPSSVRRVVTAAPQSPLLSTFAPASARAPAAFAFASNARTQQRRRYSSSKPSSPNDSPKRFAEGQVTAAPAQSTKQGGEKRRRKTKDNMEPPSNLPSVPTTDHIPHEALASSTFFSLHRPMSVTHSFPKIITDDTFAQIFAPRPKATKYADVVSTLARTVDQIEQPLKGLSISTQQDGDAPAAIAEANGDEPMHTINVRHPDGSESNVYVQLNHMSGQFLPFRPPPLPQPQSESASLAEDPDAAVVEQSPQTRIYKATFTLEETIDSNGEARIVAHSPTLLEEDGNKGNAVQPPRSFLERMAIRQIRREHVRGQSSDMHAISVKRQRKLKMKKKKYKKLMKRTRNDRRKLDRI
ncbi:Uu.00g034090.m01.CDS01 [Anthostomella pinea]|uniref:Small ribosomal subunit protein mS38 n=1 Tax=Anthostomella pinea TaxID=933095 RepID=A0AAI8V8Z6_9PEZI|nr:Uu.00g034090.m01.CDS01 [Anthostomella pinea]